MLAVCMSALDDDDRDMFEQLYLDNRQMAFHIANRILHDETLAEDAVSESFLRIAEIFQKIHNLNPHKLQYYIVITVRNTSINMKKQPYIRCSLESCKEVTSKNETDARYAEYVHMKTCVSKLSERDREILYLRVNMGFAYKEIAAALGISQSAARMRYHSAKSNLKKFLSEGEMTYETSAESVEGNLRV